MHVALLLAACLAPAAPDWVEISQHHYTKPVRGHAHSGEEGLSYPSEEETRFVDKYPKQDVRRAPFHPLQGSLRFVHDVPKGNRGIYSNHSISELAWNQNQVPGNVKRFSADNFKVKANVTPQFSLEIYEPVIEDTPKLYKLKEQERVSASIERVPNKGSVKRVQLADTPVKSPSFTNSVSTLKINNVKKYGSTPAVDDLSDEIESDIFRNAQKAEVTMSPINGVKHILIGTKENPIRNYDKVITSTVWPSSEPSLPFHKYLQTKYTRKPDEQREYGNDRIKNSNIKNVSVVEEKPYGNIITKDKPSQTSNDTIQAKNPNTNTKTQINKGEVQDTEFKEVTIRSENKNNVNQQNRPNDANTNFSKGQNIRPNSDTNSNKDENEANEEIKVNTMKNVMKFFKVVADTISKNTKRGVNGKVKYLNELKDSLLGSIKDRIDATWPDDTSSPARRRSRAATARGHVEFPSSESALMTISFLTFAVFLIKLVLQVIQTYKNKAMMVAPLVVATAGRAVRKLRTLH